MMEMADMVVDRPGLYDKEHVWAVLTRVRCSGGLPLTDTQKTKFLRWFRTLAVRGQTTATFLSNPKNVRNAFRESFPNPGSRSVYIRAFLVYLSGLTDEEFSEIYSALDRVHVVNLLHEIGSEANTETRRNKAGTQNAANAAAS